MSSERNFQRVIANADRRREGYQIKQDMLDIFWKLKLSPVPSESRQTSAVIDDFIMDSYKDRRKK